MSAQISQSVVERFYRALYYLIDAGQLKSRRAFCVKYGIDHTFLYRVEKNNSSKMFDLGWLTYLVCDYRISANWLLTGEGSVFFKSPPDKAQRIPKEKIGEVLNKAMDRGKK